MQTKTCLIYQPLGLGDIIWVQKIVDVIISEGYTVYYPVGNQYYDMISQYIKKENLIWKRESEDFPLKQHYGQGKVFQTSDELYLPLSFADRYLPECPTMISKYHFVSIPISDYRKHYELDRNYEREQKLIDTYGLNGDYILQNRSFGTDSQDRQFDLDTNLRVHTMNIDQDKENGFHLFDWIGVFTECS